MGGKRAVVALNKQDLGRPVNLPRARSLFPGQPLVSISALTGQGIDELLKTLRGQVHALGGGAATEESNFVITSLRQRDCLARALESVHRALTAASAGDAEECVALDIRGALDALGELTGENAGEDVLAKIFSGFCIGK